MWYLKVVISHFDYILIHPNVLKFTLSSQLKMYIYYYLSFVDIEIYYFAFRFIYPVELCKGNLVLWKGDEMIWKERKTP